MGRQTLKELIVIPPKLIMQIVNKYHIYNGHKGYFILVNVILNEGFYINGIYKKAKEVIQNCVIYNQNWKL